MRTLWEGLINSEETALVEHLTFSEVLRLAPADCRAYSLYSLLVDHGDIQASALLLKVQPGSHAAVGALSAYPFHSHFATTRA